MLMLTLACTPLQLIFKWTWPPRIRRELGLLTFGYVTLHFLTWLVLDQGLKLSEIAKGSGDGDDVGGVLILEAAGAEKLVACGVSEDASAFVVAVEKMALGSLPENRHHLVD